MYLKDRMVGGDLETDGVSSRLSEWKSVVNLALRNRNRVTTGAKARCEIGNEIGKVTGMVVDVPTRDSLGKRYRAFDG